MIVSVRHDQREKPNNLKLVQRTKVLIHSQLADKAKARFPTFLHNLHLVVYYIFLILNNIHQITTCRLFNPILCCSILRNAPHFFVSTSAIPVNRYLTECDFIRKTTPLTGQVIQIQLVRGNPPSHGQTVEERHLMVTCEEVGYNIEKKTLLLRRVLEAMRVYWLKPTESKCLTRRRDNDRERVHVCRGTVSSP